MEKIKYYSPQDLSIGYYLKKCEEVLNNYNDDLEYSDINDLIEFYNISLFFEGNERLVNWSDEEYQKYKGIAKKIKNKTYAFFSSINNENFKLIYDKLWFNYRDNFWTLFDKKIDTLDIDGKYFNEVINSSSINIYCLLCHEKIVKKYSNHIKEFLIVNVSIAVDVMIHLYIIKDDRKIFIPESISNDDKVKIIINYLESKQVNIRYLELLMNIQERDIQLDVRIKKKIKNRIEELKEEFFRNNPSLEFKHSIHFINDFNILKKCEINNGNINLFYNLDWLKNNLEPLTLINNYINMFEYVDEQYRWNCISNKRKLGIYEKIFSIRGKDEYLDSDSFRIINILSNMQQETYYNQLLRFDLNIERIIEWFFNEYLYNEFQIENFNVRMSSNNSTYLEKCRNDLAEFEGALKKYNFYVEDGYIDEELVAMTSKPMPFNDFKSLLKNKYVYVNDIRKFENICFALFSDQCMLGYVERIGEKANNFYELISKYDILRNEINHYDEQLFNLLLDNNLICFDDNIVKIKDRLTIGILKDLYENEVLSYWRLNEETRKQVDILIENGLLKYDSKLLTNLESEYLNYMLNNKYSNSLFLRNKYLHGTQPYGDELMHRENYMIVLRLFILLLIKIKDDLELNRSLSGIN